jgi:hypothetical protein
MVSLQVGEARVDASHESLGRRHPEEQLGERGPLSWLQPAHQLGLVVGRDGHDPVAHLAPEWREVQGVGPPARRADPALYPAARLQTIDEFPINCR